MTEKYLPIPVWNGTFNQWEAVDFRHGQRVVSWPEGFDPASLPVPEYSEGDRVQFVRDETCAREGVVRRVLLRGGMYGPVEDQEKAIQRQYLDPENITYIVTARGHDHTIKAWNILGRFVSLERISRVLPLSE
ncbi:hypothetical protein [Dictyobacter formicarum]|uniref:YopX protein domain-containing protein n=1 Tax=Dictyobacter formicarum TaxID=2778368 RepID=A0ABQ3VLI7_9CHLR|nr:hypothetical protein [Dictyobacter formicarum]GHO86223.1 hypothetical protein KSZ_42290 [Dictyobacter formicarum]